MMTTAEAIDAIRACRRDEVVVTTMSGLGLWPSAGPLDFRLLGLMGAASSIGLGIAIARPDIRVWVIDGDGSLMMQLGALAAVADAAPRRFHHIVIDNRIYAISGAQPLPAHETFDWPAAARAAGYVGATVCRTVTELRSELASGRPGPRLVAARCEAQRPDYRPGAFAIDASREGDRVRHALTRQNGGRTTGRGA